MTTQTRKQEPVKTEGDSRKAHSPARPDRQSLVDGLNHDLASECRAVLMYIQYSAKLTGPYRHELRTLFQTEISDELRHAQLLADKIVALGGEPIPEAPPLPSAGNNEEMLKNVLAAEERAIADYTERVGQAEACGELGLKVDLESLLADETRHRDEFELILAGWGDRSGAGRRP